MGTTSIQVSTKLVEELKARKLHDKESYESIIWDLLEDNLELSEEMKERIRAAEKEISEGKTHALEDIKKELGL